MKKNIYKEAREKVVNINGKKMSLASASDELGISDATLSRYETDICGTPCETVVAMSLLYRDPMLRKKHCLQCAIGKIDCKIVDFKDLSNVGYMINPSIKSLSKCLEEFNEIMEDGIATKAEINNFTDNNELDLIMTKEVIEIILMRMEENRNG